MRPTRSGLLQAISPEARLLLESAEAAATDLGAGLWLVGGGVRDLALGRHLHDIDLAFDAKPGAFVDAVAAHAPADVEVERTDRFGTASVRSSAARLDLARLRAESYVAPGALPEVRPATSIEADLARRDFTVNAMALALVEDGRSVADGESALVDPFRGLADLENRCLRVLHDRSFADDATRLWRGARTAALYHLDPDAQTAQLITEGAHWVEEISGERLWAELAYTARRGSRGAPGVALATMQRLDTWGVLRAIHPGFCLTDAAARALDRRQATPPERLAAVLLAPLREREAILDRLRAPGHARTVVEETVRLLAAARNISPDALAALEGTCEESRTAARWLDPEGQRALQSALRRWERTKPWLTAEQLISEGVPKGPELGAALRGLRRGRYLGTLSTLAEARRHVGLVLAGEANWDSMGATQHHEDTR